MPWTAAPLGLLLRNGCPDHLATPVTEPLVRRVLDRLDGNDASRLPPPGVSNPLDPYADLPWPGPEAR